MRQGDLGIDYSGYRPLPATVAKDGAKFVLRYSAGVGNTSENSRWKLCGIGEIASAVAAGLDFVANCEWYESRITEGASAGALDGTADLVFWKSRGLNKGASIYVSWDADPDPTKWDAVDAYLTAYDKALGGCYHVDCYAGTPYLRHAKTKGLIRYGWRPNAGAWSDDGLPYQPDTSGDRTALVQRARIATPAHIWQTGNYWYVDQADENLIIRTPVGSHLDAARVTPTPVPVPVPTPKEVDVDLSKKDDVAKLTTVITDAVDAYLNSAEGQATLRKANPMPNLNVGADGQRHTLGSYLSRIPGYRPFTPKSKK